MSQTRLLRERRFAPFFATQFLGAFNDNVFKSALLIFVAFSATTGDSADTATLINAAQGLFILPFFLLSALAGQLRIGKRSRASSAESSSSRSA